MESSESRRRPTLSMVKGWIVAAMGSRREVVSYALVLLKFKNDLLEWQTDILRAAQTEMLDRTKRAAPKQYAVAKKANTGNGSAYPEGFTITVAAADPISLPLNIQAALTSNPKQIETNPRWDQSWPASSMNLGTVK